ncbi:MAG: hypothetical protein RMJ51_02665 [Candidatus Calescibacterium sp.]|nr:hypothetical protein [Candidatus Calescibacterium sp.]MCX7972268.1 hypothetical protein [bacterium]MDW8195130.1 hypothetical protein [Candidatus Calescibacterium sp.]
MIVVGKDLRGVGGQGNRLWFSGMVLAKGNVMVKGTKEVDFFFDPTIVDMDFLQGATTLYVPQAYKIYDKLER